MKTQWVITGIVVGLISLVYGFVGLENGQFKFVDRTGLREDIELTQTDEVNPTCEILSPDIDPSNNPNCIVIKRTLARKFQSGRTLWDFLSLLGVPLALSIFGFWLQNLQQKQIAARTSLEENLAEENQREEILQAYFDRLSKLLIDQKLILLATQSERNLNSNEDEEILSAGKDLIRARTLSILRRFKDDGARKGDVIRFLIETQIVEKLELDLSKADLKAAHLDKVFLEKIHLEEAILEGAFLSYAKLKGAHLRQANLKGAILSNADLENADLQNAILTEANLIGAITTGMVTTGADITGIKRNLS